jgi:phosphoglycolate phosphatase-like HAD superfamily hydrolase
VVLDVFGRLTRRRSGREGPTTVTLYDGYSLEELDPSLEVIELVVDAHERGWLRPADTELLLSVAVGRDTLGRRAEREHTTYAAVHERWRRARERLRGAVRESAADGEGVSPIRRPHTRA